MTAVVLVGVIFMLRLDLCSLGWPQTQYIYINWRWPWIADLCLHLPQGCAPLCPVYMAVGVEPQGLMHARQVLYQLSSTPALMVAIRSIVSHLLCVRTKHLVVLSLVLFMTLRVSMWARVPSCVWRSEDSIQKVSSLLLLWVPVTERIKSFCPGSILAAIYCII